jgi:stage V sporulation protein AF
MNEILPVKESFDIIRRDIVIGGKASVFYYIDGFIKDEVMLKIMDSFLSVPEEDMPEDAETFIQKQVPYVEVDIAEDFDDVIRNVLSGPACLFIDGYKECILLDCRTYPARSVDEPDKDKSLRGSRDGFVETIVFNTALMRRRIRDPHLIMEMTEAGQASRTDIAICYMSDRVDRELLDNLKKRIESLQLGDLRMNQQSLAEALFKRKWFNPFPKFKYTERPDTAAACLLEGKVILLVDNSPSAMILPTSILDMIEEANDYYFPTVTAVYLKTTRTLITIATVFFTPLYLLFMQNLEWLPDVFEFVAVRDTVNIPLIFQFLLLEISIDGLRLAAMNTPTMLSTPLSVIAGIVMGEFSVQSGWFNSEVMLYMAFVAVANYTQPNFELGYALKFMRLMLLVLTALFDLYGFIAGCILVLCFLIFNKTLSGRNYMNIKLN